MTDMCDEYGILSHTDRYITYSGDGFFESKVKLVHKSEHDHYGLIKFYLEDRGNLRIAFRSSDGKYLVSTNPGYVFLRTSSSSARKDQHFHLVPAEGFNKVYMYIRSAHGKFLTEINGTNHFWLSGDERRKEPESIFTMVCLKVKSEPTRMYRRIFFIGKCTTKSPEYGIIDPQKYLFFLRSHLPKQSCAHGCTWFSNWNKDAQANYWRTIKYDTNSAGWTPVLGADRCTGYTQSKGGCLLWFDTLSDIPKTSLERPEKLWSGCYRAISHDPPAYFGTLAPPTNLPLDDLEEIPHDGSIMQPTQWKFGRLTTTTTSTWTTTTTRWSTTTFGATSYRMASGS